MKRPAFTLLETLLALVIILGMLAMILGTYIYVVDLRHSLRDQAEVITTTRRVMDRMTQELRSANVYPFVRVGMSGQAEQIVFITAGVPDRGAWASLAPTDRPLPPEHDYRLVGYRLRWVETEPGLMECVGLERTVQKVVAAEVAEEGEEIEVSLVTPHIRFLYVEYWDGVDWQTSWDDASLPRAVRLTLGGEPLDEGLDPWDYPYERFQRVIALPGWSPAQQPAARSEDDEGGRGP